MATASQLSGVYDPGLLQVLSDFMVVPSLSKGSSSKVELLLNDSLEYQFKLVPAVANANDMLMDNPRNIGPTATNGLSLKKKFTPEEGLRLSYNPFEDRGGQGRPIVSSYYVLLNKDTEGNLVIKYGKRAYGLVFLIPAITEKYEWISVRKDAVVYTRHRLKKNL